MDDKCSAFIALTVFSHQHQESCHKVALKRKFTAGKIRVFLWEGGGCGSSCVIFCIKSVGSKSIVCSTKECRVVDNSHVLFTHYTLKGEFSFLKNILYFPRLKH